MQNRFLNYYLLEISFLQLQAATAILGDRLKSRLSALAANVDCCLTKSLSGSQCIAAGRASGLSLKSRKNLKRTLDERGLRLATPQAVSASMN